MQRYVTRMFADQWQQWVPAVVVITVMATMIGLCVHQFAWTGDPLFRTAASAAGVPVEEFQILSVTIYTVVALVSWVALTVVGKASVHVIRRTHALWLLLGTSPAVVLGSTLLLLTVVSLCGAILGALLSTLLSFWALPAFNTMVSSAVQLPTYTPTAWVPIVVIVVSVLTALGGGLSPARQASRTPPGAALRSLDGLGRKSATVPRVVCGVFFFLVAFSLVISAGFADSLGVTTPAPMFNLAINAGGSSLIAVYLLCPQIAGFIFRVLTGLLSRTGLVVSALGTRSAASRVQVSATTIAPLAAGLGSIGLLLCSVNSVIAFAEIFQPDGQANRADTWMMVIVIALMMLAPSAAVVALSASGREHEIALLQAAGMRGRQVVAMIASESFAMSLAASIIAAVPVAFGGLVFVLASQATLGGGTAVVAWPVPAMLVGLIASWAALFIILLAPALTPLREGPSTQLRQQEI